jgi:Ankyrin repeats (3 copies)
VAGIRSRAKQHEGWLPLGGEGRLPVVKQLLKQWPDSIRETTDAGLPPVHTASEWSAYGSALTRFLARERTESLEVADKDGWLPLHYVAAERGTLGAMKFLLQGARVDEESE